MHPFSGLEVDLLLCQTSSFSKGILLKLLFCSHFHLVSTVLIPWSLLLKILVLSNSLIGIYVFGTAR